MSRLNSRTDHLWQHKDSLFFRKPDQQSEVIMELVPAKLRASFDGEFSTSTGSSFDPSGRYRFIRVNGRVGYQPLALDAYATIKTGLLQNLRGSIAVSVCPLEDLMTVSAVNTFAWRDPFAHEYPIITDGFPTRDPSASIFGWYWRSYWHPQMVAKFKVGAAGGAAADKAVTPYVPVEHLPLHSKQWYRLALTWNIPQQRIIIYINGIVAGITTLPFEAVRPAEVMNLGNCAMACADLHVFETELDGDAVAKDLTVSRIEPDEAVTKELQDLFTVQARPPLEWTPASSWKLHYESAFTRQSDLGCWLMQGCLDPYWIKQLRVTPEGLLIQTPDTIDVESRMYLWLDRNFEGDLAVEFEFRPEQDSGLALLAVQASGMNREDFMLDHPPRTTGAMTTIIGDRIRNYHWEFFRKCVDVRSDFGTQILVKNPFQRPLGMRMLPPFEIGRWYKLLFLQEGARLRASLDGTCVFDVMDDSSVNLGPVLNCGRLALRLMYQTKMRFRDFKIWSRNEGVEVVPERPLSNIPRNLPK